MNDKSFITDDPAVVGCTALAVAKLTISSGIAANSLDAQGDHDEDYSKKLMRDAEKIARCVLEGLGIDPEARGTLALRDHNIGPA